MAKKKSELNQYISLPEKDYLTLVEDHITLTALKIAGVEKLPMFKRIESIIKDGRVENTFKTGQTEVQIKNNFNVTICLKSLLDTIRFFLYLSLIPSKRQYILIKGE